MAIFHLHFNTVKRSSGLSCIASAAYRSGEKLYNEYDGQTHDYTRKKWIEYKEIMLPKGAPSEYKDRNTLWNAVELNEKASDSRLARDVEIALPLELSLEENINLVHEFINRNLIPLGYPVDFAIHNPPVRNDREQPIDRDGLPTRNISEMQFRNPHVHILFPVRPLKENGKWASKSEQIYKCIKNGIEKDFSTSEFKDAKEDGWEKQYRYADGDKKIWLTASEGKEKGVERISNQPKTVRFGRLNPSIALFDKGRENLKRIRKDWADVVNNRFEELDMDIRISEKPKSSNSIPKINLSKASIKIEKRVNRLIAEGKNNDATCKHTYQHETNKLIDDYNRSYNEYELNAKKIDEMLKSTATKLEDIKLEYIVKSYDKEALKQNPNHSLNELRSINRELLKLENEYQSLMNQVPISFKDKLMDNINRIKLDTDFKAVSYISGRGIFNQSIYNQALGIAEEFTSTVINYNAKVNEQERQR